MKPLTFTARNLRTWRHVELDVPAGITAIVGANGAGKSSLVSIIDLALFGGVSKDGGVQVGRELKRAMTRGADEVEVGLDFEHAGVAYRVRRSFAKGKGRLDLERRDSVDVTGYQDEVPVTIPGDWRSLTRETVAETQARLDGILGMSRRTFRASSYLAQDDGAAFTRADPSVRKAILLDALGVHVWDQLKARAAEDRKAAEVELNRALVRIEYLAGELAQRDALRAAWMAAEEAREPIAMSVSDLEAGLAQARHELDDAQQLATTKAEARARAEAAHARLMDVNRRAEGLRERIAEVEATSNGRRDLAARAAWLPHLERALRLRADAEAKSRLADQTEAIAGRDADASKTFTEAVDRAVDVIVALSHDIGELEAGEARCPTCEQPLAGEARERAQTALRDRISVEEAARDASLARAQEAARRAEEGAQRVAALSAEVIELMKSEHAALEPLPDQVKAAAAASLPVAQAAVRDLAVLDEREVHLADDRAQLANLEAELPGLIEEADRAGAAAAELGDIDVDLLRAKIAHGEQKLGMAQTNLRHADEKVARARAALHRLDALAEEAEEVQGVFDACVKAVEVRKLAERCYGRDGVPALILEARALPELEAHANRIIGELGRPYRFELRTQKETGSGTVREALDIVVVTNSGEALYEDFSGGERTRLDLSLRIALARLLAARRGADVRVLAIDEPAYLDADGFEQLARVLRDVAGEFESVLVVSHEEALRDAFDSAIVVAGGGDTGEPSRLVEVS